jgi:hypothetical protein
MWQPSNKPKLTIVPLCKAAILIASVSLLSACSSSAPVRPSLPLAFHFLEPGTTNTVVIPADCQYGLWTTDEGLLFLQGLQPQ